MLECLEEFLEVEELDVQKFSARGMSNRLRKVSLACAGGSEEEDVFTFVNKVAQGELSYLGRFNRRVE